MNAREPLYRQGKADGLRLAIDAVRVMATDVDERLQREQASTKTRDARRVRAQAYRNAERRLAARLKLVERQINRAEPLPIGIRRLGL